jgi:hypothetical protein
LEELETELSRPLVVQNALEEHLEALSALASHAKASRKYPDHALKQPVNERFAAIRETLNQLQLNGTLNVDAVSDEMTWDQVLDLIEAARGQLGEWLEALARVRVLLAE